MNKNYKRPELEVKSFAIKESIMDGDLLSNPTWDDEWDDKNTSSTVNQGQY